MEQNKTKKIIYDLAIAFGVLGIVAAVVSIGLALVNSKYSIYTLVATIFILCVDKVFLILADIKKNIYRDIFIAGIYLILAILVGFTKYSIYYLTTSFFIYCLTIIFTCILNIYRDRSMQTIIRNSLAIIFLFTYSFVFFFPSIFEKHATSVSNSNFIVLSYSVAILLTCIGHSLAPLYYKWKINTIVPVLKKTLTLEILFGLFVLIVLCSVYFVAVEPNITSFTDALWYCFAVITTIGFGDVTVSTTFGRILSVFLGIYGIAMVALFTSLIVNFYNERNKKRDADILKEIKETAEEIKKEEESIKKDIEDK